MPVTALPRPQTPFEASFAEAQDGYLCAQAIAKGQLESLEEWDPDGLRSSATEVYRRSLIARTREIGWAEIAAREAASLASTNQQAYRAARLLVHIEADRGHPRAELEQARKLVAPQPRNPRALLLARRAEAKSRLRLGVSPGEINHGREPCLSAAAAALPQRNVVGQTHAGGSRAFALARYCRRWSEARRSSQQGLREPGKRSTSSGRALEQEETWQMVCTGSGFGPQVTSSHFFAVTKRERCLTFMVATTSSTPV